MSVWLRAAVASVLVAGLAVPASTRAQSAHDRAESYNAEGRELFEAERYAEALEKFKLAVEYAPDELRFVFNLCYGYHMVGRNHDALDTCDRIQPPEADEEQIHKRDVVYGLIEEAMEEVGEPEPPPGPPPGDEDYYDDPDGHGHGGQAHYDDATTQRAAEHAQRQRRMGPQPQEEIHQDYSWSLGIAGGPLGNFGLGGDNYRNVGTHVRLYADFILSSAHRFGLQAYADISHFELATEAPFAIDELTVIDMGGALFQHIPLARSVYFTPLGGLHFSLQQPEFDDVAFFTAGARGEASFNFVFGSDDQHVVSLTPVGLNLYLPSGGGTRGLSASDYDLDSASATYTFTAGYTFRFSQPFGESVITLE